VSPDWLKLIRHHHRRKRLGLTLPFVLGALRQPIGSPFQNNQVAKEALVLLLARFHSESPELTTVRIFTCPDLGLPVVSVNSTQYHPSHARWGISKPEHVPLSIDPPYRPARSDDFQATASLLWPHISMAIGECKFAYSKTSKSFRTFDEADLQFVADALVYDEDNEL
jgi:hypothetical protein